jgi:poly-gamma-glutamate synthesis protein (capsule biosynthesis protein)
MMHQPDSHHPPYVYRLLAGVGLCLVIAACSGNAPVRVAATPSASAPSVAAVLPPTATPPSTPTVAPTATPAFLPVNAVPPVTLDTIFHPPAPGHLRLDPARIRTVLATGDVIPGRGVDMEMRQRGDFVFPVAATVDLLRTADLTVINLEAPIIDTCPTSYPEFTFCGRPPFLEALTAANIDVATLENNHIGNYGQQGINETIQRLEGVGIAWADTTTAAMTEVRGLRFGFLAYDAVVAPFDRGTMERAVAEVRPQVDVLIVAVHWGAEYVRLPEPASSTPGDDPLELAHQMIDAGADLIIGNHPHWVQVVEVYKGKVITYAHGNFIFDQMWSYDTRVSVLGRYTFYDDRLVGIDFLPTVINTRGQPVPLTGPPAHHVLTELRTASEQWARVVAGQERRPRGEANQPRLQETGGAR